MCWTQEADGEPMLFEGQEEEEEEAGGNGGYTFDSPEHKEQLKAQRAQLWACEWPGEAGEGSVGLDAKLWDCS